MNRIMGVQILGVDTDTDYLMALNNSAIYRHYHTAADRTPNDSERSFMVANAWEDRHLHIARSISEILVDMHAVCVECGKSIASEPCCVHDFFMSDLTTDGWLCIACNSSLDEHFLNDLREFVSSPGFLDAFVDFLKRASS